MKRTAIVMAAATISGIGIASANAADSVKNNSPTTSPSAIHATASNNSHAAPASNSSPDFSIRHVLKNVSNDALTSKDMNRLVSHFDDASRQRISKSSSYAQGYGDKLDAQIAQISKDWKQKYGHDFSIKKTGETFDAAFVSIQVGMPGHDAQLASAFMKAEGQNAPETAKNNARISSETIALADIKASKGLRDLEVPFVQEKNGDWKIEVPNSLNADRLRQNLLNQLTAVSEHSAQWPANENDAYRQVGHHVLMAILDQPAQKQTSANQPATNRKQVASVSANPQPAPTKATPVSTGTTHWWQFWRW